MSHAPISISWSDIILTIKGAGLTGSQLTFPSRLIVELNKNLTRDYGHKVRKEGKEEYLFHHFVLPSLLRIHGLWNSEGPPEAFYRKLLDNVRMQHRLTRFELTAMVLNAADSCSVPPQFWFEQWVTGTPDIEASPASLQLECIRLAKERLQLVSADMRRDT